MLSAQMDTLRNVRFPFFPGYTTVLKGYRIKNNAAKYDSLPLIFTQKLKDIELNSHTANFEIIIQLGSNSSTGFYQLIRKPSGIVYSKVDKYLLIIFPYSIWKGLSWENKIEKQKFRMRVENVDTLINTPFGSHRCFVIRNECKNMKIEGKKYTSLILDFYDPQIGKVKSLTWIFTPNKRNILIEENIELIYFNIDN
jgi:hypothetical protein